MSEVEFLYGPAEFYARIISLISTANHRVGIATLYIGDSEMERNLMAELGRCRSRNVRVDVLIDGNRGNRKGSISTKQLLSELAPDAKVHEFFVSAQTSLLPSRIREMLGTQHMKYLVVDDTVVITGANLSKIYFTNRQDRYCIVKNEELANSLMSTLNTTAKCHHRFNTSSFEYNVTRGFDYPSGAMDEVTHALLARKNLADEGVEITLSSPYLNLTPELVQLLLKSNKVNIVTNSIETNAFFNSKGLSKYVPKAYAILLEQLVDEKFNLYEYSRPEWSFHPKGVWVARNGEIESTIIGSSNFGYRSKFRDLEISFKLETECGSLRSQLKKELHNIMRFCKPVRKMTRPSILLAFLAKGPLRTFL
jgi:CDP-diacylglycerol--glycerol-3-phosphate 3-phosphatidyltransferase